MNANWRKDNKKDRLVGIGSAMPLSSVSFVPQKSDSEGPSPEIKNKREKASQDRCEKFLANLGWGNGFRVPFATKENQRLEQDVITYTFSSYLYTSDGIFKLHSEPVYS